MISNHFSSGCEKAAKVKGRANEMFRFKPKRWKEGKLSISPFYVGRYRVGDERKETTVTLKTTDKQVAEAKLRAIVNEIERERAGLLAPKAIREGLQASFVELMAEYLAERRRLGCKPKYVDNLQFQLSTLAKECRWSVVKDVTAESFRAWRSKQVKSVKTLKVILP